MSKPRCFWGQFWECLFQTRLSGSKSEYSLNKKQCCTCGNGIVMDYVIMYVIYYTLILYISIRTIIAYVILCTVSSTAAVLGQNKTAFGGTFFRGRQDTKEKCAQGGQHGSTNYHAMSHLSALQFLLNKLPAFRRLQHQKSWPIVSSGYSMV